MDYDDIDVRLKDEKVSDHAIALLGKKEALKRELLKNRDLYQHKFILLKYNGNVISEYRAEVNNHNYFNIISELAIYHGFDNYDLEFEYDFYRLTKDYNKTKRQRGLEIEISNYIPNNFEKIVDDKIINSLSKQGNIQKVVKGGLFKKIRKHVMEKFNVDIESNNLILNSVSIKLTIEYLRNSITCN